MLSGCGDEEVIPAESQPKLELKFTQVLSKNDIPEGEVKSFRDAIRVSESRLLVIIVNKLFSVDNGIFTELMTGVYGIDQSSDGKIYVLGADALHISDNGGDSFTSTNKFISQNGIAFYNNYPNNLVVRKTNSGLYVLWIYNRYTYNLGGTGFSMDRYENYLFTSEDGLSWEYHSYAFTESANYYPASIDNDGIIFFDQIQTDAQTYTFHDLYRSDDTGKTRELVEEKATIPNAISFTNQVYSIDYVGPADITYKPVMAWDGSGWKEVTVTIDKGAFAEKVHFTLDGKMFVVGVNGLYISD